MMKFKVVEVTDYSNIVKSSVLDAARIDRPLNIKAIAAARYKIMLDEESAAQHVVIRRDGDNLVVVENGKEVLVIEGYFSVDAPEFTLENASGNQLLIVSSTNAAQYPAGEALFDSELVAGGAAAEKPAEVLGLDAGEWGLGALALAAGGLAAGLAGGSSSGGGSHRSSGGGSDNGSGGADKEKPVTPPVDEKPPVTPPIILKLANDSGQLGDRITNDGRVEITGLAAQSAWQYSVDNGINWITGSGTSFELTADGAHRVIVRVVDVAGNVTAQSAAMNFNLDTAAQAPARWLGSDTGNSVVDNVTKSGVVFIAGLEAGATWEYSLDGGQSWVAGQGNSFTAVGDGEIRAMVRQTDIAGNRSPNSTVLQFTLDSNADAPILSLMDDTGVPGDGITSNGKVDVRGIEAGASWEYSLDQGATWLAGVGDHFTLTGDGAKHVQVRQTDAAGNVSSATSLIFELSAAASSPFHWVDARTPSSHDAPLAAAWNTEPLSNNSNELSHLDLMGFANLGFTISPNSADVLSVENFLISIYDSIKTFADEVDLNNLDAYGFTVVKEFDTLRAEFYPGASEQMAPFNPLLSEAHPDYATIGAQLQDIDQYNGQM